MEPIQIDVQFFSAVVDQAIAAALATVIVTLFVAAIGAFVALVIENVRDS